MRAQAARDGRACAQAHPDDHGGDSPVGRRWGVGIAARVDGGSWRAEGCLCSIPFSLRCFACVRRGLLGVGRALWRRAGDAVRSGQNERVFVCRHLRSCPESPNCAGAEREAGRKRQRPLERAGRSGCLRASAGALQPRTLRSPQLFVQLSFREPFSSTHLALTPDPFM